MISIIIPAYNEEQVIGLTLTGLLEGIDSKILEVIVVCNACTDKTAELVRSISKNIICIEVNKASKTNALNVGDSHAHFFPRVYLDADIQISSKDIVILTKMLKQKSLLAVSPYMQMDLSRSSWLVRAYYDIWQNLPYCREGLIGVGIYALSKEGRSRFNHFPNIIADDGFVRLQYTQKERSAVKGVVSIVTAPSHFIGLIKIKTRSRLGEYELKSRYPSLFGNDNKDYTSAMTSLLSSWSTLPKVIVYILVNLITRIRANIQIKHLDNIEWERDNSSRSYDK